MSILGVGDNAPAKYLRKQNVDRLRLRGRTVVVVVDAVGGYINVPTYTLLVLKPIRPWLFFEFFNAVNVDFYARSYRLTSGISRERARRVENPTAKPLQYCPRSRASYKLLFRLGNRAIVSYLLSDVGMVSENANIVWRLQLFHFTFLNFTSVKMYLIKIWSIDRFKCCKIFTFKMFRYILWRFYSH